MKYYQPLNDLLGQKSTVKILRRLSLTRLEMSGRRIAAELNLSPWTCHLALRELAEQGILIVRNVGRTHLFQLNEKNYIVEKLLLPLFAVEAELLPTAIREITVGLPGSIVSVILYGSISRHEERPSSDVDLLVLVAGENDRREVRAFFERENEFFIARHGNVLSPLILSVAEFDRRYRDGDELAREIVETGQMIYGQLISEVLAHESQENAQQGN
jgi:predicted nucleotidyltransferase